MNEQVKNKIKKAIAITMATTSLISYNLIQVNADEISKDLKNEPNEIKNVQNNTIKESQTIKENNIVFKGIYKNEKTAIEKLNKIKEKLKNEGYKNIKYKTKEITKGEYEITIKIDNFTNLTLEQTKQKQQELKEIAKENECRLETEIIKIGTEKINEQEKQNKIELNDFSTSKEAEQAAQNKINELNNETATYEIKKVYSNTNIIKNTITKTFKTIEEYEEYVKQLQNEDYKIENKQYQEQTYKIESSLYNTKEQAQKAIIDFKNDNKIDETYSFKSDIKEHKQKVMIKKGEIKLGINPANELIENTKNELKEKYKGCTISFTVKIINQREINIPIINQIPSKTFNTKTEVEEYIKKLEREYGKDNIDITLKENKTIINTGKVISATKIDKSQTKYEISNINNYIIIKQGAKGKIAVWTKEPLTQEAKNEFKTSYEQYNNINNIDGSTKGEQSLTFINGYNTFDLSYIGNGWKDNYTFKEENNKIVLTIPSKGVSHIVYGHTKEQKQINNYELSGAYIEIKKIIQEAKKLDYLVEKEEIKYEPISEANRLNSEIKTSIKEDIYKYNAIITLIEKTYDEIDKYELKYKILKPFIEKYYALEITGKKPIINEENPKTGEENNINSSIALLGASTLGLVLLRKKKNKID